MADLARGLARRKIPALIEALAGRLQEHHRFLLAMQLERGAAVGGAGLCVSGPVLEAVRARVAGGVALAA